MNYSLESNEFQPPRSGLVLLQICIVGLFLVFFMRLWYLQIHRSSEFLLMATENLQRHIEIFAPRGNIYDRNGIALAENLITFNVSIIRENSPDIPAALAQVSAWTSLPHEKIIERYEAARYHSSDMDVIDLVTDLPFSLIAVIEAELHLWPGLEITTRPHRSYPEGEMLAHVLGYVAEANPEEMRMDPEISFGDYVGRQGLESVLEGTLRGEKGLSRMVVDVVGRPLTREVVREPQSGQSVYLAIDSELQKGIMQIMGSYVGSVIVMDAKTGEVLALVTAPSYDGNLFVKGLSQREWDNLRNDPRYILQNRAIQSAYPPASLWKLMMIGMFLENDISPDRTVVCTGSFEYGNRSFGCWRVNGHGKVDMARSLIESCDIYYYILGEELGVDTMEIYARASGFGKVTGIDIPYETSGLVPSRETKLARTGNRWQGGDTVNASIGQGDTLTTPLQLAVFITSLLNNGELLKPQIYLNTPKEITGTTLFTEETNKFIVDLMQETVESNRGTSRILRRNDLQVGGKTGTAQVIKLRMVDGKRLSNAEIEYRNRDHAWLAAWAQRGDRQLVVVTMIEHGGGGASVAGPVTRDVLKLLFPEEN